MGFANHTTPDADVQITEDALRNALTEAALRSELTDHGQVPDVKKFPCQNAIAAAQNALHPQKSTQMAL